MKRHWSPRLYTDPARIASTSSSCVRIINHQAKQIHTYVRTYLYVRTYTYARTYVHEYIHTAEEGERRTMPNVAPPSTPELLTYVRICVRTYVFL